MVYSCFINGWECVAKQIDLTSARPAKGSNILKQRVLYFLADRVTTTQVESLQREVDILSSLITPHSNVVKYLGHESTSTKITLFISKYDSTLRHVLDEQRFSLLLRKESTDLVD